eukprot:503750_1
MEYFDEDSESEWSEDNQQVIGLFNNQQFDTIKQLMEDARNNYNFDFYAFQQQYKLDQYGCIRMINYIRSEIANKTNPEILVLKLLPQLPFLKDDKYYKPVLENDALLLCSFGVNDSDSDHDHNNENKINDEKYLQTIDESTNTQTMNDYTKIANKISQLTQFIETNTITTVCMQQENTALRAINQQLNQQINKMKKTFHRIVLEEEEEEEYKDNKSKKDVDAYYFDSYARISVHEMMLRVKVR